MFIKALITTNEKLTLEQKRLQSAIRLVADECIPATFYYHDGWAKKAFLTSLGIKIDDLNEAASDCIGNFLEARGLSRDLSINISDGMPRLVYIAHSDWNKRSDKDSKLPVKIPKDEFVFAQSEFMHQAIMEDRGVSASNAILCLAAVGLDLLLPNISLDMIAEEEIEKIRAELQEERVSYLNSITQIADVAYERFKSKDFNEIMHWAQDEVTFKLAPKARCIEESVLKLKKKTIRQAGLRVWTKGIPAITSGYVEGGLIKAAKVSAEELLKVINHILIQKSAERHLPQIAYAARIFERQSS